MKTIKELMPTLRSIKSRGASFNWTLELLKDCLHTALFIEFSTIPPYLCALWSIKDKDTDPVAYDSIRNQIAEEEMIHMGLVCNMLVALGEQPCLTTDPATYPGPLPGQLADGETVSIQGYSKEALGVFLAIEYPENGPIEIANDPVDGMMTTALLVHDNEVINSAQTIGEFYDSIVDGFKALEGNGLPEFNTERQLKLVVNPRALENSVFVINNVSDVESAVDLIKRQGEGSSEVGSPDDESSEDLAHYYRFLELDREKKIVETSPGNFAFSDEETIPFPEPGDLWPMAMVPAPEGYPNVNDDVEDMMAAFDTKYTEMLLQLNAAWDNAIDKADGEKYLQAGIDTMFTLHELATSILQEAIPEDPDGKHYGPCFRIDDAAVLPELPEPPPAETVIEKPTWITDIQYFFTEIDISCMQSSGSQFDLSNYDDVYRKADDILAAVRTGHMPPGDDRDWSPERVQSFENWINIGKPEYPVWQNYIKDFFTQDDVTCMENNGSQFNLWNYDDVVSKAGDIYNAVEDGYMPPGNSRDWPPEQVAQFGYWKDNETPEFGDWPAGMPAS